MGSIAENILALRKQRGLSQTELAEKIGISRQAVSNWERGIATPDVETLQLLAEALEVDFNAVLTGAERSPKPPGAPPQTRTILLIINLALFAAHLAVALFRHLNPLVLIVPGFLASFSLFLFFLFRHVITQNDYSILAGYDPKQDDPEIVKKQLETIDLFNLLFAFLYSSLCFLTYGLQGVDHARAFLLVLHIVSLSSCVIAVNLKMKSG